MPRDRVRASSRLVELEAFRGFAALAVLVFHVWSFSSNQGRHVVGHSGMNEVLSRTWIGVTLFFVLSGFLIYRPFATATLSRKAVPELRVYARSRLLRIVPPYWLMLSIFIAVSSRSLLGGPLLAAALAGLVLHFPSVRRDLYRARPLLWRLAAAGHAVICAGAVFFATALPAETLDSVRQLLFLHTAPETWALATAWTLGIEMSFYAVLPLVAAALARTARGSAARLAACLLPLVALGVGYRIVAATILPALPVILPGYVDLFACGMLVAVLQAARPRCVHWSLLAAGGVAALALAVLLRTELGVTASTSVSSVAFAPLVAASFAFMLALVVRHASGRRLRPLRWRPFTWLGQVSYGLYLWQLPVIVWLIGEPGIAGTGEFVVRLAVCTAATVVLAAASWYLVEVHALALKSRPRLRRTEAFATPVLAPA